MPNNQIFTKTIFSAEAIVASASATSSEIDLASIKPSGYFSLQVTVTGDGTAKLTYSISNDGTTYVTPTGAPDIKTAHVKTTGTSGTDIYSFSIEPARYLKIIVTETGGANAIAVTATIAIQ